MTNPTDLLEPARAPEGEPVDAARALEHYRLCCLSRAAAHLVRREVLVGHAKFGISGDGKELAQVALATQVRPGDWRAGYYRDQTLALATGITDLAGFFAQLYADPGRDPHSGGRQMICHFATPTVDADGTWRSQRERFNSSADISSTAGQMARGLGLAFASKKYRASEALADARFSDSGNEVSWVTIGDASTSEGAFWETLNAAGVLQVPMVVSVWDDGYGISVPTEYQTTKGSISEAVAGLQREGRPRDGRRSGIEIVTCAGYDYPGLLSAYARAARLARQEHVPVLVHVVDVTQQLGHSTSGSHERYKDAERLAFEKEFDCNRRFREWLLLEGIASVEELKDIEAATAAEAKAAQTAALKSARARHRAAVEEATDLLGAEHPASRALLKDADVWTSEALAAVRRELLSQKLRGDAPSPPLQAFVDRYSSRAYDDYSRHLYLEGPGSVGEVVAVPADYAADAPAVPGYRLLNEYFDALLARDPRVLAFGEDLGKIGDVNQGFAGLQDKHGETRVFDTGIREWSIIGQAIGLAMRGLRPIVEVQYLDYVIYGLSPLSDDLACLLYRTDGQQRAPAIIRTRGHRLEGIWHSGSPMGMLLGSLRGMHLCVPRNMLQAVGMYNTLMKSEEPALVIECLNAYRLRERRPSNLASYTVPLGQVEVLREGTMATIVTYGACVAICEKAAALLSEQGVDVEVIDVQTLLPFDTLNGIRESLQKTSRLLVVDEDVPGGASAYILDEVLGKQDAFRLLDAAPVTLSAKAHRPPYGSDGDYFTKPNVEGVMEAVARLVGA